MSLAERMGGEGGGPKAIDGFGGTSSGGGIRTTAGRHALLPLRIFLGITFVYAGLNKLADSAFFADGGNGSLASTLEGAHRTAAAPWLIDLALNSPQGFGYAIAAGEIAVGAGTLLGLWARLAAFGGGLLSLIYWLTVSWQTEHYYYSSDLVLLMAWLPLLLSGAPSYSLDAVLVVRQRRRGQQIFGP
ncbi:DoxX family protein [Streptomyces sp. NPDC006365]|uniref:DoxX family protein n=1 Tax=Streptomyces sp. NPDC006365 TaxID=3364744 RepID=UPI0036C3E1AC